MKLLEKYGGIHMATTILGKTKNGKALISVEISNKNGMRAKTLNLGANLMELFVPNHAGETTDVVLGFQNVNDYEGNESFYGCTVARNANRIGGAAFDLNGRHYTLENNDNGNNLHSGSGTLAKKIWEIKQTKVNSVTFAYSSPDMDMGFPGAMEIEVTYELTDTDALVIRYRGISNQDTVFNPTNHSYFNLDGQTGESALDHYLTLDADYFTWANESSIPDGTIKSVKETPMDFTKAHTLGERIEKKYDQLQFAGGYDHNFILNQSQVAKEFSTATHPVYFAAKLENNKQTRAMYVYTDTPGIQVYTGNYMNPDEIMKNGKHFVKRGAVALETQYFPNAVNVESFRSPILKAGENGESITVYQFDFAE